MKTAGSGSRLLSIGALSRETGIHSSTIRIWESRYGAIAPARTAGGARRYSEHDVQRLKWMKALVDAGRKPSALARLSLEELKAELIGSHASGDPSASPARVYQVGLFADAGWTGSLPSIRSTRLQMDTRAAGGMAAVEQGMAGYDVAVVFVRGLQASVAERFAALSTRLGYCALLIVYEFSNTSALKQLKDRGIESLKHPVDNDELLQLVERLCMERAASAKRKAPQYSMSDLQSIQVADNTVLCECPKHLASLLISLHGFIDYTTQCADESPSEALVHQRLREFAMASVIELESGLKLALGSHDGN